jgi:hypothetical protein
MNKRHSRCLTTILLALALSTVLGCQPAVAPPPEPSVQGSSAERTAIPSGPAGPTKTGSTSPEEPSATQHSERDVWFVYFMQDAKVGYSHLRKNRLVEQGQELIHTQAVSELTLRREQSITRQRIELQTWETPAGKLERFESRLSAGPGEIVTQGKRLGSSMIVGTDTLGRRQTEAVPMGEDCGGFFAAEQSLERQPLKPGESRTITCLIPVINRPAQVKLTALEPEKVSIRGLEQQLLKVRSETVINGNTLTSFSWINERGETIKTLDLTLNQESYKTTREIALATEDLGRIDLMVATTVPLKGELQEDRPLARQTYVARMKGGNIAGQFASDEFQQVEGIDEQSVKLTVRKLDLDSKVNEALRGSGPTNEDLEPNSLIQSDDAAIVELANSVGTDEKNPVLVARMLEKAVRNHIHTRNYGQAFATAAEVVRSQEGDCTENAVLLAAVCRARKIPARVVLGLVHYPRQNGFAYHMWNEVWTGDRWLPLDATVAQGTVGADHIKLKHASLQGVSAYAVMLPLLQVIGRLELEVVRVE